MSLKLEKATFSISTFHCGLTVGSKTNFSDMANGPKAHSCRLYTSVSNDTTIAAHKRPRVLHVGVDVEQNSHYRTLLQFFFAVVHIAFDFIQSPPSCFVWTE